MSEINYSRLRSLTARQLIGALIRDGFSLEHQAGSHQQYYHPNGRRVTVSFHRPGDTFAPKILKIMIEGQAKWSTEDITKLGLL